MNQQYQINERVLLLKVKKAPLVIRIILFVMGIAGILLPILGVIGNLFVKGQGLSIVNIVILTALFFISLFILRLAIWNTRGEEEFYFGDDHVFYQANYGWFKDKRKKYNLTDNSISFEIRKIGYEKDHKGILLMQSGKTVFGSAVKMPIEALEQIIKHLKSYYN